MQNLNIIVSFDSSLWEIVMTGQILVFINIGL